MDKHFFFLLCVVLSHVLLLFIVGIALMNGGDGSAMFGFWLWAVGGGVSAILAHEKMGTEEYTSSSLKFGKVLVYMGAIVSVAAALFFTIFSLSFSYSI